MVHRTPLCWCRADLSTNRNAHVLEALFPATPQFEEVAKNGVTKKGIFFRVSFSIFSRGHGSKIWIQGKQGGWEMWEKIWWIVGGTFYILDILSGTKPNALRISKKASNADKDQVNLKYNVRPVKAGNLVWHISLSSDASHMFRPFQISATELLRSSYFTFYALK